MAMDFFESKAFADWKKSKESEFKIQGEIIKRLNAVIKSTNNVSRTVAKAG